MKNKKTKYITYSIFLYFTLTICFATYTQLMANTGSSFLRTMIENTSKYKGRNGTNMVDWDDYLFTEGQRSMRIKIYSKQFEHIGNWSLNKLENIRHTCLNQEITSKKRISRVTKECKPVMQTLYKRTLMEIKAYCKNKKSKQCNLNKYYTMS